MNETVIKTLNLTKRFGSAVVVNGLNLDIKKGELYGLVGPDGGGKSTVLRMLAAIMDPDSGEAWVAGHSVLSEGERIKEKIGYMSQKFGLYEDLTVIENINFYADLYEVPKKERPERTEKLLGFSNLTPFKDRLAGKLSGGMKQKLGLACALIHTPEVLFLDEPTNGVDPVSRRDFWRILYDLLKEEVTIFVSTSYLDEAERCTRVGLMHNGVILMEDNPMAVRKSLVLPMVEIWSDQARAAAEFSRKMKEVRSIGIYGDKLHIAVTSPMALGNILSDLQKHGISIRGYRQIVPSLEDIFIAMVEK